MENKGVCGEEKMEGVLVFVLRPRICSVCGMKERREIGGKNMALVTRSLEYIRTHW
jgi:hypothetical protein